MAARFIESFDSYPTVAGVLGAESRWLLSGSGTGLSLVAGRFGGQAVRGSSSAMSAALSGAAIQQGVIGLAVQIQSSSGTGRLVGLSNASDAVQITVAVNSTNQIVVYRGGTSGVALAVSVEALTIGVWYYLEIEFRVDNPAGYIRVYANGGEIINYAGNTVGAGDSVVGRIGLFGSSSTTTVIDDVYAIDTLDRLGEARVQTVRPSADTATKNFTPNAGTDNFSRVNELLVDGDTSYVSSSTVGHEDLYALEDLGVAPESIFAVQVRVVARKDDAATRVLKSVLKSGATTTLGSDFFLSSSYTAHVDVYDTNPDTAAPWTKADIDALQVGQRITV